MQNIGSIRFGKARAVFLAALLSLVLSMGILLAQAPEKSYADIPNNYTAEITVKGYGTITVELNRKAAPTTVDNFVKLAKSGFYDGLTFHRIYNGFMIQGGGFRTDGTHTDAANIKGEFASNGYNNPIKHTRGVISMARGTDANSASSEFFIMHQTASHLDGSYAAFGNVVKGMNVVDSIASAQVKFNSTLQEFSTPVNPPVIESVKITEGVSSVGWKQSGGRWWYSYDSVTAKGLGKSYPTNEKIQIGGQWYSFDAAGWMKTGWIQENGKWQYLNGSGLPASGWVKTGSAWYYLDPNNSKYMVANTEKTIDGATYRFNGSGAMFTGWVKNGSDWLYYSGSGAKTFGWLKSGSSWYYLDPVINGVMAKDTIVYDKGLMYFFDSTGIMGTGWIQADGDWYYANSSGAAVKGWQYVGGAWYYMNPSDGKMVSNQQKEIDKKTYFFNSNGAMRTGWVKNNSTSDWYYCNGSGAMVTGWLKDGSKWYYLDPTDGIMASDEWVGNYYLDKSGAWTKSK